MDASPRNASPALQNGEKGLFVCLFIYLVIFLRLPKEDCCNPLPDITREPLTNLKILRKSEPCLLLQKAKSASNMKLNY